MNISTIDYYERNARAYSLETFNADLSETRSKFLRLLPHGARILDVGCGGGRDLRAFKAEGYEAEGLEPAPALAQIARESSGCPVHVSKVETMDFQGMFDGVWACASLLHLPRLDLSEGLVSIHRALKRSGYLFLSMQKGAVDGVLPDGRFYARYDKNKLLSVVCSSGFDPLEVWESGDSLHARVAVRWINILARSTHL